MNSQTNLILTVEFCTDIITQPVVLVDVARTRTFECPLGNLK